MKKYLLTWYGITDLKASLGLTPSDGPVLSAIKQGDYTDVIILAYTNKEKINKKDKSQNSQLKNSNTLYKLKHAILSKFDSGKSRFFADMKTIDKYSNTEEGHLHYKNWLKKEIKAIGVEIEITLLYNELEKLNDANGIYKAVSKSLNLVSADNSEKEVTVFLSPGTPVMAFNWAYAALMNPGLHIKVIASSDSRKPPEEIALPFELLNVEKIVKKKLERDIEEFDVVFHLFGEQRMPSMLGIRQFKSKKHIFINSDKYPAVMMHSLIGDADFEELRINPFDPRNVEASILQKVSSLPNADKIGFNLTGGTKLMYAGALQAAKQLNAVPFYFETLNHNLIYLDSFEFAEVNRIDNIEVFINTNAPDLEITNRGILSEKSERNDLKRTTLTKKLWENRYRISALYKELSEYTNNPGKDFHIKNKNIETKLINKSNAKIRIFSDEFSFPNWPDFAQYLCGGWFEEYIYLDLKKLQDKGLIYDLRINLEVSQKEENKSNKSNHSSDWQDQLNQIFGEPYQEMDIVFTDGKRFYVIECKAGKLQSDHVVKLEDMRRFFGGIDAKAALVSVFEPDSKIIKTKIEKRRNVELISGGDFVSKLKKLIK